MFTVLFLMLSKTWAAFQDDILPGEIVKSCNSVQSQISTENQTLLQFLPCTLEDDGQTLFCEKPNSLTSVPQLEPNLAGNVKEIWIRQQKNLRNVRVGDLKVYKNLKRFFLEYSGVQLVEPGFLACLPELRHVSLAENQLTGIQWQSFVTSSANMESVDLAGNLPSCDCSLYWIYDYAQLSTRRCIKSGKLSCEFAVSITDMYHIPKKIIGLEELVCKDEFSGERIRIHDYFQLLDKYYNMSCPTIHVQLQPIAEGAQTFHCLLKNLPNESEPVARLKYPIEVQVKTENISETTKKITVTEVAQDFYYISVDNASFKDNGWILCRYNLGQIPAVDIKPLVVNTKPIIDYLQSANNSCVYKIIAVPSPYKISWKLGSETLLEIPSRHAGGSSGTKHPTGVSLSGFYTHKYLEKSPLKFYETLGQLSLTTSGLENVNLHGLYTLETCNSLGCIRNTCEILPLGNRKSVSPEQLRSNSDMCDLVLENRNFPRNNSNETVAITDVHRIPLLVTGGVAIGVLVALGVTIGVLVEGRTGPNPAAV